MKKRFLLPLLMMAACADVEFESDPADVRIDRLNFPSHIVVDWPDAILLRVETTLGEGHVLGQYQVQIAVEGPGLDTPLIWFLRDDGDFYDSQVPPPGQYANSGDNVPGDGIFSALIDPNFSSTVGEFNIMATLFEGEQALSQYVGQLERVDNSAPLISSVTVPDTSFAGTGLLVNAVVSDSDGMADIASVLMESQDGLRTWDLSQSNDSMWAIDLEPSFAAGMQGLTAFNVRATDRFDAFSTASFEVEIENSPPVFDADAMDFWFFDENDEVWVPYTVADTLVLQVPAAGLTHFYNMALPLSDDRGQADIALAQWGIATVETAPEDVTFYPMDDLGPDLSAYDFVAGDGVWSGGFQLPGSDYPLHWSLHFQAQDHVGQWADAIVWPVILEPFSAMSPSGGQSLARVLRSTFKNLLPEHVMPQRDPGSTHVVEPFKQSSLSQNGGHQ